jgi:hypothetical protein
MMFVIVIKYIKIVYLKLKLNINNTNTKLKQKQIFKFYLKFSMNVIRKMNNKYAKSDT